MSAASRPPGQPRPEAIGSWPGAGHPPGEEQDPAESALVRYAAATSVLPRPDLALRITQRIAAEPPSTAPRRYLRALAALDAWAAWRAFRQTLAAASGHGTSPAPMRPQALAAVLLTLVIVSGGGVAGVMGASLLISELSAGPEDQPLVTPVDIDRSPQPLMTAEPVVSPDAGPTLRPEPRRTPSPEKVTRARAGDRSADATPRTSQRPRQDSQPPRDRSRDQSDPAGRQDRRDDPTERAEDLPEPYDDRSEPTDEPASGDDEPDDQEPPDDEIADEPDEDEEGGSASEPQDQ